MCVVYLLTPQTKLRLSGGRYLIERKGKRLHSLLHHEVDCVVLSRQAEITMPALYALLEQHAGIFFVDYRGRLIGQADTGYHSFERTRIQYAQFEANGLLFSREILRRKLTEQQHLLRSYAKTKHDLELAHDAGEIKTYRKKLAMAASVDELRGIEGIAARKYFSAFPLILSPIWKWEGRNRRPPRDPVNALLSFGYALLERDVRLALLATGLDPGCGFLHANNGRKDSLVFDFLEPFRPSIIDHFILRALNLRIYRPDEFTVTDADGCRLSRQARDRFLAGFEQYMEQPCQRFNGLSPRAHLRQAIDAFARDMFRTASV